MSQKNQQILDKMKDLLENKNSIELSALLKDLRESEIAEFVELLDNEDRRTLFNLLDDETGAIVLERVNEATRSELFDILTKNELRDYISELDPEDAADILAEMEDEDSQELLNELKPHESKEILKLLQYSEDSAGGIMDLDIIRVPEDATVEQAIDKIKRSHIDEDFFFVFVVDKKGKFLGDVRIRHLLTSDPQTNITELLEEDTIHVSVHADQEEVKKIFNKNSLIVAPVLDDNNRLVGRITADRILEVAQEEAEEDIYTMAGTEAEELEDTSIFRAARIRMTWLLPCLMGTAVTAVLVLFFKEFFHSHNVFFIYTTAIAFMPMIAAISGNAGLQTSAIVISGLAGGHLADTRVSRVFAREVRVALLVAISCGLIGGLICWLVPNIFNNPEFAVDSMALLQISMAFMTAMFSAIMVATTLGLFLPFLFRQIGIDPAISSGPLVTTANDSISVAIYLSLTFVLVSI